MSSGVYMHHKRHILLLSTLEIKRREFKESYRYMYIDIVRVIPTYSYKMSASIIVLDFQTSLKRFIWTFLVHVLKSKET